MLKKTLLFLSFYGTILSFAQTTSSKIGANPYTIDISAILELEGVNKGLLLPRLTTSQRDAIVAPAEGLIIYNSSTKQLEVNKGTSVAPIWSNADIPDATDSVKGKIKLTGALGGTADFPTVPDLITKENISNKSTVITLGTSDVFYPSQNAVKTYVDAQVASATIADADATTKGKIQLAGDLTGTAALPIVANGAITTEKIADLAITDTKVATGINASKVGLGNVDNTSDAAKPISTATEAALNTKEPAVNKTIAFSAIPGDIKFPTEKLVKDNLDTKQNTLLSGINIKTINGASILGVGDLVVTSSYAVKEIVITYSASTWGASSVVVKLWSGPNQTGTNFYTQTISFGTTAGSQTLTVNSTSNFGSISVTRPTFFTEAFNLILRNADGFNLTPLLTIPSGTGGTVNKSVSLLTWN
jgi:hypothetical protein